MDTLTTAQYAVILDQDENTLAGSSYSAVSSDESIAFIGPGPAFVLAVGGVAVGTATITATRTSDGATATLDVTVTEDTPAVFSIHLGTPAPKG